MSGPAGALRRRLTGGGLYLLTPAAIDTAWIDRRLVPVLALGPGILQLRLKEGGRRAADLAARLRLLTREAGTLFIVNDDIALAEDCEADGVHLGQHDASVAAARQRLGDRALIGASCYGDVERAAASVEAGADYLAFGAIFASPTKPHAPVVGTAVLEEARRRFPLPLVAIGGITAGGAGACRHAGADWVAVVDAVWGSADPIAAVQRLQAVLAGAPAQGRVSPCAFGPGSAGLGFLP